MPTMCCHYTLVRCPAAPQVVRQKLPEEQRKQLRHLFNMMDQDGSKTIEFEELYAACKLLGFNLGRLDVADIFHEVDRNNSGKLNVADFEEAMTQTVHIMRERKEEAGQVAMTIQVPFEVLTRAYKRKYIMAQLMSDDPAERDAVVEIRKRAEAKLLRKQKEAAQMKAHFQGMDIKPVGPESSFPSQPSGSTATTGPSSFRAAGSFRTAGDALAAVAHVAQARHELPNLMNQRKPPPRKPSMYEQLGIMTDSEYRRFNGVLPPALREPNPRHILYMEERGHATGPADVAGARSAFGGTLPGGGGSSGAHNLSSTWSPSSHSLDERASLGGTARNSFDLSRPGVQAALQPVPSHLDAPLRRFHQPTVLRPKGLPATDELALGAAAAVRHGILPATLVPGRGASHF